MDSLCNIFFFFFFLSRYNSKLALLALPSVIFEPRFRGSVRNLVYSDQPGVSPRRQEMRQPRDIKVSKLLSLRAVKKNMHFCRREHLKILKLSRDTAAGTFSGERSGTDCTSGHFSACFKFDRATCQSP